MHVENLLDDLPVTIACHNAPVSLLRGPSQAIGKVLYDAWLEYPALFTYVRGWGQNWRALYTCHRLTQEPMYLTKRGTCRRGSTQSPPGATFISSYARQSRNLV